MTFSLALDLVLVILLAATIAYCVVLNRRLSSLRDSESVMQKTMAEFTAVITRAETGISGLKKMGATLNRDLASRIETGRVIADDLSVMVDSGAGLADRLEATIAAGRETEKAAREGRPLGARPASLAAGTETSAEGEEEEVGETTAHDIFQSLRHLETALRDGARPGSGRRVAAGTLRNLHEPASGSRKQRDTAALLHALREAR